MRRSKILSIASLLFTLGFSACALAGKQPTLPVVDYVDLQRYQGVWFEIAKIPNWFQEKCSGNTSAEYQILDNGKVKVINSCDQADKPREIVEGRAKLVDSESNAKLKVTFAKIFGKYLYLFGGDYWVTDLDQNYQWVIVGHPKRDYGWVLSRSPSISPELQKILNRSLLDRGYDPCAFEMTAHDGVTLPGQRFCEW